MNKIKLVNIGFGNMINIERILCAVSPDSAPVKRLMQEAKERGTLIDATTGRKTKCVIVTDTDSIILSYMTPEALAERINEVNNE